MARLTIIQDNEPQTEKHHCDIVEEQVGRVPFVFLAGGKYRWGLKTSCKPFKITDIENLDNRAYFMFDVFLQLFYRLIGFCNLLPEHLEVLVHVLLLNAHTQLHFKPTNIQFCPFIYMK